MRLILTFLLLSANLAVLAQNQVTAKLVANRVEIQKGESFYLGIHLTMSDHWHTYWENPGFAGQPPSWKLEPVAGLEIGDLHFPWPKRWVDKEGFVSYGYDDETVVFARATYRGSADSIEIKGSLDWVACREMCIPGHADGKLTLRVGEAKPANEALFADYTARVPQAYHEEMPFSYTSEMTMEAERWYGSLTLRFKDSVTLAEQDPITLFPLATNDMADLKTIEHKFANGAHTFKLSYEAWEENVPADFKLGVALKIQTAQQPLYARLQIHPAPGEAPVAASGASGEETGKAGAHLGTEAPASQSLWFILFAAFVGGLILNLMPCVLPVLSLKVFSLLNEVGESSTRRITSGWVYTAGILSCFAVISGFFIAARSAGQQLGIGFQFQSPEFVIAISTLIFVMGMSFLGVFHLGQPSSDKLHSLSMKSGYQGAFFNGVLMTILSTPCTAPMLGAAYAWALSSTNQMILLTFSVIAFGLAFPYLVLCYFPKLLKFLPKPGAWMEQFKVGMGFLLLGTLVWLFYILSDLTGTSGVAGTLAFLLAVGAACYIYGQTWYSESRVKGLLGMTAVVTLGIWLGLFKIFDISDPQAARQTHLDELRLKFLSEAGTTNLADELDAMKTTADEIKWVPYSEDNLAYFRDQDRMIFVDFTAAWCATCKVNERAVIDTRAIRKVFADNDVVTIKADYTDKSDSLTLVLKSFNRAGVPMYLVYPGKGDPILLPEIITKDIVLTAMDAATSEMSKQAELQPSPEGSP